MFKSELEILVSSVNKLKASSKPAWGIMTSPQMLKHCK